MAKKKKVALCLEYPIALRGGVSVLVETLLEGLKDHYELLLVSRDKTENIASHPVMRNIVEHIEWNPLAVSPKTSQELSRRLAARAVQLAHFHSGGVFGWGNRFPGYCPIPYVNKLRIPVCSTVHGTDGLLDGFCGNEKPLWFKLSMLPLAWTGKMHALAHTRQEITVSQHNLAKLRKWYWPLRKKFLQIYHSRLRKDSQPGETTSRESFVLNVGHIAWRKGQLVLVEAFAQIAAQFPEWKLCLAGEFLHGSTVENIHNVIQTRGLGEQVLLLGERLDAMELMQKASVYVQPSNHEALGLALQEAMFVGCPSIGTRAGGIPELIDHERTGLLVDVGDSGQMALALEKLISDPELRASYGSRGAQAIVQKGMTMEQMIAHHVQLYESIFNGA